MLQFALPAAARLVSTARRLGSTARWLGSDRRTVLAVASFAAGVAGWSASQPFLMTFGFGRAAVAGLLLSTAAAFAGGTLAARRFGRNAQSFAPLVAAAGCVLLPWLLAAAERAVAAVGVERLAAEPIALGLLTLAGLVALGVPAAAAGLIFGERLRSFPAIVLCGAALGIAADALLFAPTIGLDRPLLAVAIAAAVGWLIRTLQTEQSADPVRRPRRSHVRSLARVSAAAASGGLAAAVVHRVLTQLAPAAGFIDATLAAALAAGCGLGLLASGTLAGRLGGFGRVRAFGGWLAAAGVLGAVALFPRLIDLQLELNAHVETAGRLVLLRALIAAAAVLPIGCGIGLIAGRRRPVAALLLGGAVGVAAAGWILPAVGVSVAAVIAGAALLASGFSTRPALPRTRLGWAAPAVGLTAIAGLIGAAGGYDPARSARVLFSTQVFVARQLGLPAELATHLDDTRLLGTAFGPAGTVSVWKQRGETFHLRLDGVPLAAVTRRTDLCPPMPGEMLRVALPLLLRDAPGSLLLLGDPAGSGVETAIRFPLRQIVRYDADDTGRRLLSPHVWPDADRSPFADARVTTAEIEPRLALAADARRFDVIVSDPGVPSVLAAAPSLTREFYAKAAVRLTADGVFCQRFRYADFGPTPLAVAAATMRGAFGDVIAVEVGTGDFLLLGSVSRPLVDERLTARLKRPHVRATLAQLGWDWSVPLNLLALDAAGLRSLDADAGANTTCNGLSAYTLPQEVMRWGPKGRELRQAIGDRGGRLFTRGVPERDQAEVLSRIAEVTGQRRLMTMFPDQPWAYRKEVRGLLQQDRPKAPILQAAAQLGRTQMPDRRRRLAYFQALGDAVASPTPETLADLEAFGTPYDPLISYFLRGEIAPLYARMGTDGAAAELEHRLYAAYFADGRDRSVRSVAEAIELLAERPETLPGDADRFDHLNSLVQMLLARWEARGTAEPRSAEVVMVDIERSLAAADVAVAAMTPLASAAGLSDDDMRLRRKAIDRTLVRPLRSYRTALLPHLRKPVAKPKATADAG